MRTIYTIAVTSVILITIIALSASTSPPVNNDPYTGLYYVHGSKIITYYNCPFIEICGPDQGPFIDTTRIASVVVVKLMQDKTDTLHFFGLPGADEGEIKIYFGDDSRSDKAGDISLYDTLNGYKIYGYQTGNSFEIQYNNANNFYEATGSITQGLFELQGQYTMRTTTVDYVLTGERIDH